MMLRPLVVTNQLIVSVQYAWALISPNSDGTLFCFCKRIPAVPPFAGMLGVRYEIEDTDAGFASCLDKKMSIFAAMC